MLAVVNASLPRLVMSLCQAQRLRRPTQYSFKSGGRFVLIGVNGEERLVAAAIGTKSTFGETWTAAFSHLVEAGLGSFGIESSEH